MKYINIKSELVNKLFKCGLIYILGCFLRFIAINFSPSYIYVIIFILGVSIKIISAILILKYICYIIDNILLLMEKH